MPVIPADVQRFRFRDYAFQPVGQLEMVGARYQANMARERWAGPKDVTWAARIIVGFNVRGEPTWDLRTLKELVRRIRVEQSGSPNSTFIAQSGYYQHPDGHVDDESGAQVIVFNEQNLPRKLFDKQMYELAEVVTHEFRQASVILEIQKNGIRHELYSVTWPEADAPEVTSHGEWQRRLEKHLKKKSK